MLDRPNLPDDHILAVLHTAFALPVKALHFLPLGADSNTPVYRAETADGVPYFVKLRLDDFHEASLTIPRYFYAQGLHQIIPPLLAQDGQLWAALGDHHLILYPFVRGRPSYEHGMTPVHWRTWGAAMRHLHALALLGELTRTLPRADFMPEWPARMQRLLHRLADTPGDEPLIQALAAFLGEKHTEVTAVIAQTQRLATALQTNLPPFVLCHGDIDGWNLLIDEHDHLFIVDGDTLILAPKERDLMFIGGGHGDSGYGAVQEEALFYAGYGQTIVNGTALAYYRFARALEDIVLFAEQILTTDASEDRQQALGYLQSNFLPESTLARAYHALASGQ